MDWALRFYIERYRAARQTLEARNLLPRYEAAASRLSVNLCYG